MSDADDQLGGTGGERGEPPAQSGERQSDPGKSPRSEPGDADSRGQPTGERQAAANRDQDPPA